MWRNFVGRNFRLEGFCERLFAEEGFVGGGILPQSHSMNRIIIYVRDLSLSLAAEIYI